MIEDLPLKETLKLIIDLGVKEISVTDGISHTLTESIKNTIDAWFSKSYKSAVDNDYVSVEYKIDELCMNGFCYKIILQPNFKTHWIYFLLSKGLMKDEFNST